jgi:lysophospholipase L1-like esterase
MLTGKVFSGVHIPVTCYLLIISLSTTEGQIPDPDPERFAAAIEAFTSWDSKNYVPEDPVLFVGSSSIRLWKTAEWFSDLPVINRGFGGAHISDILHYFEQTVAKYNPKAVVFYAGDNDVAGGKSAQQVFSDFKKFSELLSAKTPNCVLIYLPIKPSTARWHLWSTMKLTNQLVRNHVIGNANFFYADTATPMLDMAGKPRAELLVEDGLHLNKSGYKMWSAVAGKLLSHIYCSEPDFSQ